MIPMSMLAERPMIMPPSLTTAKSKTLFMNEMDALSNPVFTKTADEINFVMNTQPNLRGTLEDLLTPVPPPEASAMEEPEQEQEQEEEEEGVELAVDTIKIAEFSKEDDKFFRDFLTSNKVKKGNLIQLYADTRRNLDREVIRTNEIPPTNEMRSGKYNKTDLLDFFELMGVTTEMMYEHLLVNRFNLPADIAGKLQDEYFVD